MYIYMYVCMYVHVYMYTYVIIYPSNHLGGHQPNPAGPPRVALQGPPRGLSLEHGAWTCQGWQVVAAIGTPRNQSQMMGGGQNPMLPVAAGWSSQETGLCGGDLPTVMDMENNHGLFRFPAPKKVCLLSHLKDTKNLCDNWCRWKPIITNHCCSRMPLRQLFHCFVYFPTRRWGTKSRPKLYASHQGYGNHNDKQLLAWTCARWLAIISLDLRKFPKGSAVSIVALMSMPQCGYINKFLGSRLWYIYLTICLSTYLSKYTHPIISPSIFGICPNMLLIACMLLAWSSGWGFSRTKASTGIQNQTFVCVW